MNYILVLILIISCSNQKINVIDQSIKERLHESFPSEHIFDLADLDLDTKKYFIANYPDSHPGMSCSAFRFEKIRDCFILLADSNSNIKRLIFFENVNSNSPLINEIPIFLAEGYRNNSIFIFIKKRGIISDRESDLKKEIKMENDGIELNYFEKSSWIIYWNFTKFSKILISD